MYVLDFVIHLQLCAFASPLDCNPAHNVKLKPAWNHGIMYSYQFERFSVTIVCPFRAAYVYVVAELGDFHAEEHGDGYLSDFVFLPLQSSQFNKEVAELHRKNKSVHTALTGLVHEHATCYDDV